MTPSPRSVQDRADHHQQPIDELIRQARRAIDHARDQSPAQLKEDVDRAERAAVRLRNRLIDRLREGGTDDEFQPLREALDHANVAISLLAGVEYPAGGIQRKLLDQADEVMKHLEQQGLQLSNARDKG